MNLLLKWEKLFKGALIFSVGFLIFEAIFESEVFAKWLWHFYLLAFIFIPLRQMEFRSMRMFIVAFVPFLLVTVSSDLTELVSSDFFKTTEVYFKNATALTYIWMAAILFSHNRQSKAAERDRLKRLKEDEINRAIAIRKVELEVLVSNRTAELTMQKEELEQAFKLFLNSISEKRLSVENLILYLRFPEKRH